MSRILPVRTGWAPLPGDTAFYPDDLPEDWRLTYFANALHAVLLGADVWGHADARCIEQWCRDVPASFRFYLRDDDSGMAVAERAGVRELLGDRFGGWLLCPEQTGECDLPESAYALLGSVSAAAESRAPGLACRVPDGLAEDLRAARTWLESLAAAAHGRPALALMGQARFEDVRRWQSLVQLLGLG